jgi:hypothetical protein
MLDRGAKARAAALDAQKNPEAEKVVQAFAAVLETEPGKLLFAHLFYMAGYDKADHVTGREGDDAATEFNTIRRSFYVDVRKRVPRTHRKTLMEVELLAENGWGSGLPATSSKAPEAEPAK